MSMSQPAASQDVRRNIACWHSPLTQRSNIDAPGLRLSCRAPPPEPACMNVPSLLDLRHQHCVPFEGSRPLPSKRSAPARAHCHYGFVQQPVCALSAAEARGTSTGPAGPAGPSPIGRECPVKHIYHVEI